MRVGIKQFSDQLEQYREDLIKYKDKYDYIELYVYPDAIEYLKSWCDFKAQFDVDFTIHAPHFSQHVNLADESYFEDNKKAYKTVNTYAKELDAEYTVVHGGMDGSVEEIVRQIEIINPYKMRIENKPYVAPRKPDSMVCRGATVEEIKYIMNNYGCGFNLDIGHAFCSAVSQGIEQIEYVKQFLELKPESYHISDGEYDNRIDIHYHLGDGDYNWTNIFPLLDKNLNWTLETITKKENKGLSRVVKDIEILRVC
ncbi:sugar phosphate isomerase/epimerase [bacterium]|nr:sugar phosphate isomerase/epimerase [bacterium]